MVGFKCCEHSLGRDGDGKIGGMEKTARRRLPEGG